MPPWSVWPCLWAGLSAFYVLLARTQTNRQAFAAGWLFGISAVLIGLSLYYGNVGIVFCLLGAELAAETPGRVFPYRWEGPPPVEAITGRGQPKEEQQVVPVIFTRPPEKGQSTPLPSTLMT